MARIHWLDALLAPLTWLERARGRRRLALLWLYASILVVGGVLVGREAVLWQLPGAPEPFDLARYGHVYLADSDNAMVFYKQATKLLVFDPTVFESLPKGAGQQWHWARADPKVRAWVGSNRAALEAWLEGTGRPDALSVQPERFSVSTPLEAISDLQILSYLGIVEATRRHDSGDLEGAWTCHRGAIRSSLHAGRHAGMNPSLFGSSILRRAIPAALDWADDPRLTPELLRRALADLAECRSLASLPSDAIRVEYFSTRSALADPGRWLAWQVEPSDPNLWYNHLPGVSWARDFFWNEPRRSQKILRLITAGQLAQSDSPADTRLPMISPRYAIYAIGTATPRNLARIDPRRLVAWAEASGCRVVMPNFTYFSTFVQANEGLLDKLRLRLAERIFQHDHAGQPPRVYGDLFPAYLDALPPGTLAGDLLAAP